MSAALDEIAAGVRLALEEQRRALETLRPAHLAAVELMRVQGGEPSPELREQLAEIETLARAASDKAHATLRALTIAGC